MALCLRGQTGRERTKKYLSLLNSAVLQARPRRPGLGAQCRPCSMSSHMTTYDVIRNSRPIGWIKAARKVFETFPDAVRDRVAAALTIAAEGGKADIAGPLKGLGPGVFQIAIRYRTDAWRVVYVTELGGRLWVVHAFQKKSKMGIRTPKPEVDLIVARLARLKREVLS